MRVPLDCRWASLKASRLARFRKMQGACYIFRRPQKTVIFGAPPRSPYLIGRTFVSTDLPSVGETAKTKKRDIQTTRRPTIEARQLPSVYHSLHGTQVCWRKMCGRYANEISKRRPVSVSFLSFLFFGMPQNAARTLLLYKVSLVCGLEWCEASL